MVSSKRWDGFEKLLIKLLKLNGFGYKKSLFFSSKNGRSFFILPLCKIDDLRGFRQDNNYDFSSPAIFLISGEHENPFKDNPYLNKDILTKYFGNPKFGNIKKAILFAEIDDTKQKNNRVLDVTLPSFWDDLLKVLNDNTIKTFPKKYRKSFYETFIDYYFPNDIDIRKDEAIMGSCIPKGKEAGTNSKSDETKDVKYKDVIERAESLYCKLNNINYNELRHRVKNEIFRAPVPFPLQELIDARNHIRHTASSPLRLLLVDNKSDKLNSLIKLIEDFDLADLFAIEMIDETGKPFDYDRFKSTREESVTKNYAKKIYGKIANAHFILLDFFLNKENTYLAFDFIQDILDIKKQEGDVSTTWYFITSAVYDSVVKYSQSGLLAEYYESAVVCAGDDPTNNKRQIIFLYKLLTFINARLNSFKGYKGSIMKCRMLNNKACGHSNDYCRKPENCLFPVQSLCRKYTAEYDEIIEIFPGTEEEKFKEIVELLENIITQFLWLPEADWHMIQRQIEYLDLMLKREASEKYKNHKFSCRYIVKEMVRRSKIY